MTRFAGVFGMLVVLSTSSVEAAYPVLSLFTKQANGPYAPSMGRYIVVDPVPVAGGMHGHPHGPPLAADQVLWERRNLNRPTYPYGWFGAAMHTTQRWTNGGYYDNYVEGRTLRGR
jgi:hypothetical protein